MKSFFEIYTDKSEVNKTNAEEALFHLYNSIPGLNHTVEFIWQSNLLDCVEYCRKNQLVKTSIKSKIVENLSIGEKLDNHKTYKTTWTQFNLYKEILSKLLIQSNIIIFPQINKEGHEYLKKIGDKFSIWKNTYENVSFFIPLKDKCIISETRLQIYATKSQEIAWSEFSYHRGEGKPAIHAIGTNIFDQYWLNNVRISKSFFKVRSEELDPQKILTIRNVEQRMELIRYVGMEHMLSKLPHKIIDKLEPYYELLWIKLDITRNLKRANENLRNPFARQELNCYYLKMLNPSIGTWHIEAVGPECRTVQLALNWRANNIIRDDGFEDWSPEQIT